MRVAPARRLTPLAVIAAVLAAACVSGQAPPPTGGEIRIALDAPLSTPEGWGLKTSKAAEFAIRRHPTIGNYRLTYVAYDAALAGYPYAIKGSQNVRKMVKDARVLGMVGPYTSNVAKAEIPIASQAGLAMVSPSTTNDCLTVVTTECAQYFERPSDSTFFRIAARDGLQGTAMAGFAVGSLKVARVALLAGTEPDSVNLATTFSRELAAAGGTIVWSATFPSQSGDFVSFLREARKRGAEAIYVAGLDDSFCTARAQMKSIFSPDDPYFLVSDWLLDSDCIAAAADNAGDHMISTVPEGPTTTTDPLLKPFGGTNQSYALESYDAAMILIDAIGRAIEANNGKLPDRRQVVAAVARTHELKGVTGTWSFDANGDATTPVMSYLRVEALPPVKGAPPAFDWKPWMLGTVKPSAG